MDHEALREQQTLERQRRQLHALCKKFITDNRIYSADCVYQTDRVIENAYEFIADVCDIVGYYEEEE